MDLGVIFSNNSVFANKVSTLAAVGTTQYNYMITEAGVVHVNVGANQTLPNDIRLSYYYKDPTFDASNKYSVDYKNGILWSNTDLNDAATIQYKVSYCSISYDIANKIVESEYDGEKNLVTFSTENLHHMNPIVKVFWSKKVDTSSKTLLKDYFSPIIDLVAFRFI